MSLHRFFFVGNRRSVPFRIPLNMAHFRSAQVLAVVDRPMDLTTVLQKLEAGEYDAKVDHPHKSESTSSSSSDSGIGIEFFNDVHLTFSNGAVYHKSGTRPYESTKILADLFDGAYAVLIQQGVRVAIPTTCSTSNSETTKSAQMEVISFTTCFLIMVRFPFCSCQTNIQDHYHGLPQICETAKLS